MSDNPNILDLPKTYTDFSLWPVLIDPDHSTYQLQTQGNSQVYVEKYIILKKNYRPFLAAKLGSQTRRRMGCVLIKEDGFTDIGGGYASFLRHYARIPDSWFDYENVNVNFYFNGGSLAFTKKVGINYDYGCSSTPVGFSECGFALYYENRNFTLRAKATRYYLDQATLEKYINNNFIYPDAAASWRFNPIYPEAIQENDYTSVRIFGDNRVLPSRLILNAPRTKVATTDSREAIVEVDNIKKWQASIYELTRYTSQLLPDYNAEVESITVQVDYTFTNAVTQDQKNINKVSIDGFTDVPAQTLRIIAQQDDPNEDFSVSFPFIVTQGDLRILSVSTTGGSSTFDNIQTITTNWNGSDEVIFVTVLLDSNVSVII